MILSNKWLYLGLVKYNWIFSNGSYRLPFHKSYLCKLTCSSYFIVIYSLFSELTELEKNLFYLWMDFVFFFSTEFIRNNSLTQFYPYSWALRQITYAKRETMLKKHGLTSSQNQSKPVHGVSVTFKYLSLNFCWDLLKVSKTCVLWLKCVGAGCS